MKKITALVCFLIAQIFFCACEKINDKTVMQQNVMVHSKISAGNKPNIILIVADDMGYEIPTYNGGQSYSTPAIDSMAYNGLEFTNFFSHPDGPASRLALVTGKYNFRNWVKFGFLDPKEKTIANLLEDAGYATCFTGKWQFDGGDNSIHQHGFQNYRAFMPFNPKDNNGHDQFYRRYKNPYLYENGQYMPDSIVKNKYSEDLFLEYASNFIGANQNKPFFLMYSHNLIQRPWVPSPDDPDYALWNPETDDTKKANKKYFPGMVAYMDKTINRLLAKLTEYNLQNSTIVFFISDNATNTAISSVYNGQVVYGAKNSTARKGINVPCIAFAPGNILPGLPDTSLIDMTDFLPTIANLAHVPIPKSWGPVDGITFYDNLQRFTGKQRELVYCYWPALQEGYEDVSYVFDYTYKLYDSLHGGYFLNIAKDAEEMNPLDDDSLTDYEKERKEYFNEILRYGMTHK